VRKVVQLSNDLDADAILALLKDAFAYMVNRIDPLSSLYKLTPQNIRDFAAKQVLLAIMDDTQGPLACLFVTEKPGHLYLGKWCVHCEHRGNGYARALLDWVQEYAVGRSSQYLELETRIELTENHATFQSLGFEIIGHKSHPGFDRPTSLTMRKNLDR